MSEKILDKKEIRDRLNSMSVKPEGLEPRRYGVSIKYFNHDKSKFEKRVDYECTVDLKLNDGAGELSIDKENIFYNQHEPDLINEIIADSISKSIYPAKTHYDDKGIASNQIINHEEIIDRWKHQKDLLLEKYQSESLTLFFEAVDKKLSHKIQLEKSLKHDWFWNLFFHPKLINYGDKRTIENELYLAVIPYRQPLRFSGMQKIEKIPTDYHSFMVNFESKDTKAPAYFYPKNAGDDLVLFMSLQVNFDLDEYHHFPMHSRAYFEVYSKNWEGKKLLIKKIEFTMYQINSDNYKNKKLSKDSPFITGGLVKLPPNKWGFDNFENLENDW